VLKTTPAPGPVLIKIIHSWSYSGFCCKSRTPYRVDSGTCPSLLQKFSICFRNCSFYLLSLLFFQFA